MIKRLIENLTGYWLYKARYLPAGADLRVDLGRLGVTPDVLFDVGANTGQTYEKFRRSFPSATIYCFEPVQSTFESLARTIAKDANARAELIAFGSKREHLTIRVSDVVSDLNSLKIPSTAGDARSETIRVDTIDDYARANQLSEIDILKIDTEGWEIPVLDGARQMLQSGAIKTILCEVGFEPDNDRNTSFFATNEFLATFGYTFYAMYDVRHFARRKPPSFANALFVSQELRQT